MRGRWSRRRQFARLRRAWPAGGTDAERNPRPLSAQAKIVSSACSAWAPVLAQGNCDCRVGGANRTSRRFARTVPTRSLRRSRRCASTHFISAKSRREDDAGQAYRRALLAISARPTELAAGGACSAIARCGIPTATSAISARRLGDTVGRARDNTSARAIVEQRSGASPCADASRPPTARPSARGRSVPLAPPSASATLADALLPGAAADASPPSTPSPKCSVTPPGVVHAVVTARLAPKLAASASRRAVSSGHTVAAAACADMPAVRAAAFVLSDPARAPLAVLVTPAMLPSLAYLLPGCRWSPPAASGAPSSTS